MKNSLFTDYQTIFTFYKSCGVGTLVFVFIRLITAPFFALEKYIPKTSRVLDLGCGHGLFSVILRLKSKNRYVYGIDPDTTKIKLINHVTKNSRKLFFSNESLSNLINKKEKFDAIVIVDVVYLLSDKEISSLLKNCLKALSSNGHIFIKTSQKNKSFGHQLAVAQEKVMVQLLKKTHSNESQLYFREIDEYKKLFTTLGLKVTQESPLKTLFFHPHYLFVLSRK
jgi:2-polyprenyl-3-methyl-5-hydroxy-6-metoxy-1,4-benzoquinol methylase